jgi:hypothetical protein
MRFSGLAAMLLAGFLLAGCEGMFGEEPAPAAAPVAVPVWAETVIGKATTAARIVAPKRWVFMIMLR